jgi:two-component system, OmpR family, sensor histidine kinase CreC
MRATQLALLAVVIIVAAGFALLADHLLRDIEAENYQATEEVMVDMAEMLAALVEQDIAADGRIELEALRIAMGSATERRLFAPIFELSKEKVTASVYVTDQKGVVIYDSDQGTLEGQDFSQKRDVLLTLRGIYGARSSRTVPQDSSTSIMHVAAPLHHAGKVVGVLTVRKPKMDQWAFIVKKRHSVQLSLLLISCGIVLFVCAVLFWVMQPLRRLTAYAQALQRGERTPLPELRSSQEVQALAQAMEDMRTELEGRDYAARYVQTLTHELKSPLAAIRATAELLAEDRMEPAQRERFLASLRSETERTEHLIRQLLRLAEVEQMKSLERVQSVNLGEVVEHAVSELHHAAQAKQLKCELQLPEQPLTLRGDEMLLKRAVMNLVENAIDFSPTAGTISITLSSGEGTAQLVIGDEGPGIQDFAQGRLFERFYSLKHQATGRKGSGLGLCFVKETAELHGGSIALSNRQPKGAEARLQLPIT